MQKINLILASASPRRRELLGWSFFKFKVQKSSIEEIHRRETPAEIVMDLALQKAQDISKQNNLETSFIIGSDTVVVHEGKILEKPESIDHAKTMLMSLSDQEHEVYTGVSFIHKEREHSFYISTKVRFEKINPKLLDLYLKTGESMDKAGAYGIQGAALGFIGDIQGSYSSVVGFPINTVIKEMEQFLGKSYEELYEIFS